MSSPTDPASTASVATSAAGDAAHTAGDQAKRVTGEAASQARSVVDEAKGQVSGLANQAKDELRAQAADRGSQAAGNLRTLSDRVGALAAGRPEDAGPLAGYLDEAQGRISDVATRLDERGLEGALDDLSRFARRRPGLFMLGAVGAGFVVGRLVRSGVSASKSDNDQPSGGVTFDDEYASATSTTAMPAPELLPPPVPQTTGLRVP